MVFVPEKSSGREAAMFNIVLVEPEIPQNTGNISRTCAVTGSRLHLVRPLGFAIDDRQLKRAGLDYWKDLDLTYYDSFEELEQKHSEGRFFLFSTHAKRLYSEVSYRDEDFLVFGKETAGLGSALLSRRASDAVRIPMKSDQRSLNLSNTAAIALYEALRQTGFPGLD
jgi:tRNA (cytidine/uridine-2'-O-)-methyltransferase